MKKIFSLTFLLFFALGSTYAQRTISEMVTSAEGPLIGASVQAKGSITGTVKDIDGNYSLKIGADVKTLVISYIGFTATEVELGASNVVNVTLMAGSLLDEVVVTSKNAGRTKLESAVAVDVIDLGALVAVGAQTDVNAILNYVAPSFTSNSQTISDGTTDHIKSAKTLLKHRKATQSSMVILV